MTKGKVEEYIKTIVSYSNRTSYKFYLLLAILEFGKKYDELSFESCGREMLVQAWNDISNSNYYFSKIDKLIEIKNDILFRENALEYCSKEEIRLLLTNTNSSKTKSYFSYLTQYCVYLLLSYGQWNEKLKSIKNYHKVHALIENLSQTESCLYEIHNNAIILNSEYFDIINQDVSLFEGIVKEALGHYLSKVK